MAAALYLETSPETARKRRELAPDIQSAFEAFGRLFLRTAHCRRRRSS